MMMTPTPTRRSSTRRWMINAAGAAAAVATLAVSVPAAHADTTSAAGTDQGRARLEKLCAKVPTAEAKLTQAITRLQADANTRGSLAWLQAQIDRATAGNRSRLVAALQQRLQVRTQLLSSLQARQQGIAQVKQICAQHGLG